MRQSYELPSDRAALHRKAVRLEWITIAYLLSAIAAIYVTLGASQAMKAAWFEDILSLVPAIAFLIGTRIRWRKPNSRFPYGYHRVMSIGYLVASLALFLMGLFILYDSVSQLLSFEHPPIGTVQPFGDPIWLGWLMLPALAWSAIPAVFLGRAKLPLARGLHDKVLYADAEMNKADWMTAGAAMVGVIGIGFGLWWADGAAATFISLDIASDGFKNLKRAVSDLMDSRPTVVDGSELDPIVARVETELRKRSWVEDASVRLRENGHVFFGEALVVPSSRKDLSSEIERAREEILELDWRLYDIAISPVESMEPPEEEPAEK
jgi:cation diffusion facilitator family transporter